MKTLEEAIASYQGLIDSYTTAIIKKYGVDECSGTIGGYGMAIMEIYGVSKQYIMDRITPNLVSKNES